MAAQIPRRRFAHRVALAKLLGEQIAVGVGDVDHLGHHPDWLFAQLKRGHRDRNRHKGDGSDPREEFGVHLPGPQLPNIRALPAT